MRSRFASFLFVLLPAFMFLGLLAPAAVTVEYEGEEETIVPVTFRNFQLAKRPLFAHGEFGRGAIASELTGLRGMLASGARFVADGAKRAFELAKFEAETEEDAIILDDDAVGDYVVDSLFDGRVEGPLLAVDLTPLWDPALFDIIPPLLDRYGYSQFDDFAGTGVEVVAAPPRPVAVPEPGTAALIAFGLAGLAIHRRSALR